MGVSVGIDVSKDQLAVALQRADGRIEQAQFANTRTGFRKLDRYLEQRQAKTGQVCLEATGCYSEAVAEYLHGRGSTVSVVNPARITADAASQLRRTKTDQVDAGVIADFCRTPAPPAWTPPDPAWRELQALVRHRLDLEDALQRQRNRWHALTHSAHHSPVVAQHLADQIALLEQQLEGLNAKLDDHFDQHPALKRQRALLVSIQGVGALTAAKLLAEVRDLTAFTSARQVVAYAGLNPRQRQSGSSVRGASPISKTGSAALRAALYLPAVCAQQHNPLLRAFAERLARQGLCKMEIVVAVMRKLLHLAYGVLKSGQPFDPHYLDKQATAA